MVMESMFDVFWFDFFAEGAVASFFCFRKENFGRITKFRFQKFFFPFFLVIFRNYFSKTCFQKLHLKLKLNFQNF